MEGSDGAGNGYDISREELKREAEKAVEQGEQIQKIIELLRDNYDQREKLRELRGRLEGIPDQLVEAVETDEEVLVLTGESVEAYEEYTELGEPDEVADQLARAEQMEEELREKRREEKITKAASLHGLRPGAIRKVLDADGLEVEVDEDEESATVRPVGGDEERPLTDHIEEEWSEFAPALKENGDGGSEESDEEPSGTPYPEQSGGSPPDSELSEEELIERKREEEDYRL